MLRDPARRWLRRCLTIPAVLLGASLSVALAPVLVPVAWLFDLASGRRTFNSVRVVLFVVAFLLNEVVGLLSLLGVFLVSRSRSPRRLALTFRAQDRYTAAHLTVARALFSLTFVVEGGEQVAPGPLLVLVRHTSIIDTVLPGVFIAGQHQMGLRYVLKRELLWGPCLDLAGHWLPNHFVSRSGADTRAELEAVRALKAGLGPDGGVLIYPEGTRFTAQRRAQALARLAQDPPRAQRLAALTHVLPPRPGGVLALLAAEPRCDVLLVAHHGFEGFARVGDVWAGDLVGREVRIRFTRIPASAIPATDEARLAFLDELWLELDRWVAGQQRAA